MIINGFNLKKIINIKIQQFIIKELRYGKYYILEKEAPEGYVLNDEKMFFEKNGEVVKATMVNEKGRLKLFCLMQDEVNFLILDEHTNHIDITTREILEDTLNEYEGTILFISHDRYFINKVATKIVSIDNNKLIEYIGNYDNFVNINSKKK